MNLGVLVMPSDSIRSTVLLETILIVASCFCVISYSSLLCLIFRANMFNNLSMSSFGYDACVVDSYGLACFEYFKGCHISAAYVLEVCCTLTVSSKFATSLTQF